MAKHLNIDDKIYDALNYNEGIVTNITDNIVTYRDSNYNTFSIKSEYAYRVNVDLTNKYGYTICDEHNENIDYPYFIPQADENAYEFELEHFSLLYA